MSEGPYLNRVVSDFLFGKLWVLASSYLNEAVNDTEKAKGRRGTEGLDLVKPSGKKCGSCWMWLTFDISLMISFASHLEN